MVVKFYLPKKKPRNSTKEYASIQFFQNIQNYFFDVINRSVVILIIFRKFVVSIFQSRLPTSFEINKNQSSEILRNSLREININIHLKCGKRKIFTNMKSIRMKFSLFEKKFDTKINDSTKCAQNTT